MELLNRYLNGSYSVKIYDDGTKIRRGKLPFIARYPESCDIKITDWCDGGCSMCHEMSTINGQHADLSNLVFLFNGLPSGVELAIGGGDPLSHPGIRVLLRFLKHKEIIANITVNARHLLRHKGLLNELIKDDLVKGIGVTYDETLNAAYFASSYGNKIVHFVMGVHTVQQVRDSIGDGVKKILLLGYKKKGRGIDAYNEVIEQNLYGWFTSIHTLFNQREVTVSFDNLAIEQLKLRRFFSDENWLKFYQGDDGQFTFYLDLVKREYAISSTSNMRFKMNEADTLITMFGKLQDKQGVMK